MGSSVSSYALHGHKPAPLLLSGPARATQAERTEPPSLSHPRGSFCVRSQDGTSSEALGKMSDGLLLRVSFPVAISRPGRKGLARPVLRRMHLLGEAGEAGGIREERAERQRLQVALAGEDALARCEHCRPSQVAPAGAMPFPRAGLCGLRPARRAALRCSRCAPGISVCTPMQPALA